jgi:hypothetical protein
MVAQGKFFLERFVPTGIIFVCTPRQNPKVLWFLEKKPSMPRNYPILKY